MDLINSVGVIVSVFVAIVSIGIAVKSFHFSISLEETRNKEIQKENEEYLKKVDFILKKTLQEINHIVNGEVNELLNKTSMMKKRYIKKSINYTVQQVKSRLHIIYSFEFSTMDSQRLNDLYEIRTLVAGIDNTLFGFEKNLTDNNFKLQEYERYLSDTIDDIKEVTDSLHIEV